eukprot:TRINITY_DN5897_c0_g1_i1.p1 TRINITY_DN5897_c0_g1~~TRINITY_DN5897_c0_g1_i1.p1  ORF type:complete len:254 (-),score=61.00 TRINITY_DN5897_c0_g1_i1:365-1126(-)
MKSLWQDPAIQKTWAVSPTYQLQMTQMDYLIGRLDHVIQPGFQPTPEDILHCRQRTTGAIQCDLVKNNHLFQLIDVGGQKPERAKWQAIISDGNGVSGIIYFASLDEFNMQSSEEKDKTKMQIAIETWANIFSLSIVRTLPVLLVFNKIDLFEQKISGTFQCFTKQFPDFPGPETREGALNYIKNLFFTILPSDVDRSTIRTEIVSVLNPEISIPIFEQFFQFVLENGANRKYKKGGQRGEKSNRGDSWSFSI